MLDIGWMELLLVGVVALIVVGPNELPVLLRTIGRYVGMVKRQAGEFRAQFDDALRESEFDQFKSDMESIKNDAVSTLNDTSNSIKKELDETDYDWDAEEPIKPSKDLPDDEKFDFSGDEVKVTRGDGTSDDPEPDAEKPESDLDDDVTKPAADNETAEKVEAVR